MSGIIYESETGEGLGRFMIDLGDGRNMTVNVTSEGVIMDVFGLQENDADGMVHDDLHLGTAGMMFDEWAEWVENPSGILNLPDTDCQHCGERIHVRGVWSDGTGGEGCRSNSHHPASHGRHQP